MRERRALRQFTLSTGKSAGRNSSGRITLFHRGGGSKRLQQRIDLKRIGGLKNESSKTQSYQKDFHFMTPIESFIFVFLLYWIFLDFMISMNQLDFLLPIGHEPLNPAFLYFDNNGDAVNVPALESSSSSESLATFRAQIARDNEAEIYQRLRTLENLEYYNLPPQNNRGDYEHLVREHFDQALSVNHFREILDREYFELTVLERKGLLQDRLFNLMLGEQNIDRIMDLSPYTNIRKEAYHFIQDLLSPVSSLRHPFQRDLMDGSLNTFLQDLHQNGRNAEIYRGFYSHFTDEDFRRACGLPLP